jgi:hypothetical protein
MKKIALQLFSFLCLFSTLSFGQTYTSGLQSITGTLDAQIDINTTTDIVTLTLIGSTSGWLSLGFNSFGHDDGDVVMFNGTNLVDRTFTSGEDEPITDSQGTHNWTVTSNTTDGSVRTVVATRARVSSDTGDYDFSATPTNLFVVGAYENNFNIGNEHSNKGTSTLTFSLLGVDDHNKIQFSMSPNPATSNLKIVLPSHLNNSSVEIFDVVGRQIYNGNLINTHFSLLDVSSWNSGVYLVRVLNDNSSNTKRFIKQ